MRVTADAISQVCLDLGIDPHETLDALSVALGHAVSTLQLFVNNAARQNRPVFSLAEAPVRTFVEMLDCAGLLEGRTLFCCIDEYENLLESQQAVLNTYIKHAEPPLSYKVGVRKNGLRTRQTIDSTDLLEIPNDYEHIEIAMEGFEHFAREVADLRLRRAHEHGVPVPQRVEEFLPALSMGQEALLLGAESIARSVLSHLEKSGSPLAEWFGSLPPQEAYFVAYWNASEGASLGELVASWHDNPTLWKNRLNNYGYASLFWLSVGRKGARIRKYYSGVRTLLLLASGNIRYFLELIDAGIGEQLGSADQSDGPFIVTPHAQTKGARTVGGRRLNQLEGLAEHGVELKRLVLAIGKVFFELARSPLGRTPEVTSFVLTGAGERRRQADALLDEGVAYLAFEATPRTKATTSSEIRDDEYRLHPVFSAFFEISHRKKRRMNFSSEHLLGILDKPSAAISSLLEGAVQTDNEDLPDQLAFFSGFFNGGSGGSSDA